MPKIKREDFANKAVLIGDEAITFDKDGIGEIKSDELYSEVVTFPRFSAIEEEPKKEPVKESEEPKKEPVKESVEDNKEIDEKKAEPKEKVEEKKEEKKSTEADTKAKSKK